MRASAFCFAVLMAAAPTGASAQGMTDEECKAIGELAGAVMELRQADANLSDVLDQLAGPASADPKAQGLIKLIIVEAYKLPGYSTPENQQEAIAEYRNNMELACYTAELTP